MSLILIVEEEYGNAEILQILLDAEGYRTALASNGKHALDVLVGEKPGVIVSDFMMPHLNGAELGHAVRRDPELCAIPFVLVSATSEEVVQRSFADYDVFLTKPLDLSLLLAELEKLVRHGRVPRVRTAQVEESMR